MAPGSSSFEESQQPRIDVGHSMLFHSADYLLFLALAVLGFWALRGHAFIRTLFIFLASCLFYMAWSARYIVLILGSTVIDYVIGLLIPKARTQRGKKALLAVSICSNVGLLATFKYFNFFSGAVHESLAGLGMDVPLYQLDVLLPVGISFYTFQTMSYTLDIYRGRLEPTRNFLKFAFFVSFFPQLVAGPIVRASEFLPQLDRRPRLTQDRVGHGLFLILRGLVKKVAFADLVAVNLVDRVFETPALYSSGEVMVALYAYSLQLYCDFSGYTDVARGSAMLMGLELPENFDRPYQAASPAEFWRRWHMTLSRWLRDYLYFPLGGSRCGPVRAYANLWLTFFIIGLWHGAAWTFVVYGLIHATAMVVHRFAVRWSGRPRDAVDSLPIRLLKVAAMFHFTVLTRILFRATSLDNAWDVTSQLLFDGSLSFVQVSSTVWLLLAVFYFVHFTPRRLIEEIGSFWVRLPAPAQGAALGCAAFVLAQVVSTDVVPYIYFQF